MVFVFGFALFVCSDCLFVYSIGFRKGTAHPARRLPQSFRSGACRSSVEPSTIFLEVHVIRVLARVHVHDLAVGAVPSVVGVYDHGARGLNVARHKPPDNGDRTDEGE